MDMMILSIGEILFDIFPSYRRPGGAPFNVAFHLRSLGFNAALASRVGTDELGSEMLAYLRSVGFPSDLVQRDDVHPTGQVSIELDRSGNATFSILPDAAFDYLELSKGVEKTLASARLVYFGSLAQRTAHGQDFVRALVAKKPPEALCFYDVNLRPGCETPDIVLTSLEYADIVKMNDDELGRLKTMLGFAGDEQAFAEYLMATYGIRILALTRGARGSELYVSGERVRAAENGDVTVVDTVGAGDGYSAMLIAGLLSGWPPDRLIRASGAFARSICAIEGAIPVDNTFYRPYAGLFRAGNA
ncbi:MAG TPA: carbohydrate kinase [Spirochaetota bacterium]|nr:carbohydrate kinase [Spirochaetota bacterium]